VLTRRIIEHVVGAALEEDAPWGDLTAELAIPERTRIDTRLVAREAGVFAGGPLVVETFRQTDPGIALNLSQRMSGVATLTSRYVAAVAHTRARIADTRKTTPGLRALEKHAVRAGGGANHRFGLSDAIMVKDNHLAALGAVDAVTTTAALRELRERAGHTTSIIVEVDRLDQLEAVLAAEVTGILLDNFSLEDLVTGVRLIAGRAVAEASGGVTLDTVAAIAETGVDVISVGQLTHGARALDLGLDAA
jgi:nicotinate-nucleotide pyrophosphorylase (carboxylating)